MPYTQPPALFPSARQVIAQAWQGFIAQWRTFLGLALLSLLPVLFLRFASILYVIVLQFIDLNALAHLSPMGFAVSWGIQIIFWAAWAAAIVAVAFVSVPAISGQLFVITNMKSRIGWREAYALGRQRLWAYMLVAMLVGLAVVAGLLLFVVPGMIVAVWWGSALVIVVVEQLSGMAALRRSRELTRGFFWTLVQRWLALAAFTVGVQAILFFGQQFVLSLSLPSGVLNFSTILITLLQWLWGLFLIPFWVLLQYVVYAHLRLLKKDQPQAVEEVSPGAKVLLGFLLVAIGIFGTAVVWLAVYP